MILKSGVIPITMERTDLVFGVFRHSGKERI